jgi:hypothetical protein
MAIEQQDELHRRAARLNEPALIFVEGILSHLE